MFQEFNCDIYSRKLWVATSWEDVKGKFVPYADYTFEEHEKADGVTYPRVELKRDKKYGVLIV